MIRVVGVSPMQKHIRPKDAAEALGVSTKTIYKLVATGEIVAVKVGRAVCISLPSLEEYVARAKPVPIPERAKPAVRKETTKRRAPRGKKRAAQEGFRHVPPSGG